MRTFPLRDSPLGRKRTPRSSQQQAGQSQGQPQGSHGCAPEWAKAPVGWGQATVRPSVGRRRLAYVGGIGLPSRLCLLPCSRLCFDRVAQKLSYNIKVPSSSSLARMRLHGAISDLRRCRDAAILQTVVGRRSSSYPQSTLKEGWCHVHLMFGQQAMQLQVATFIRTPMRLERLAAMVSCPPGWTCCWA